MGCSAPSFGGVSSFVSMRSSLDEASRFRRMKRQKGPRIFQRPVLRSLRSQAEGMVGWREKHHPIHQVLTNARWNTSIGQWDVSHRFVHSLVTSCWLKPNTQGWLLASELIFCPQLPVDLWRKMNRNRERWRAASVNPSWFLEICQF